MAFRASYPANYAQCGDRWYVSEGEDKASRDAAIVEAGKLGRISSQQVTSLIGHQPESAGLLEGPEPVAPNPEVAKLLAGEVERLRTSMRANVDRELLAKGQVSEEEAKQLLANAPLQSP